nr:transposase [Cytophagales bacterium]
MAYAYTIKDQHALHFVTFTVHQWVDVFTRPDYCKILIDSVNYCQQHKGLKVYAWVLMTNHCHFILGSDNNPLSNSIRDLKKFTAKAIIKAIEDNPNESRKRWLLWLLKKDGSTWFWEAGYHGEEIFTPTFLKNKIDYIHQNPVRAGIVEQEEEYLNSSCGEFYGIRKSPIELTPI